MSTTKTCHICYKPFKCVNSHISKSHSYVCLIFDKDKRITESSDDGEKTRLFWQGKMWDCVYNEVLDSTSKKISVVFGRDEFDGEVYINLKSSATGKDMWEIDNVSTCESSPTLRNGKWKHYGKCSIQVVHKRADWKKEEKKEEEEGVGPKCEGCGVRESKECKSDCSYQAKRRKEEEEEEEKKKKDKWKNALFVIPRPEGSINPYGILRAPPKSPEDPSTD